MEYSNDGTFPLAESGPRRSTQEPPSDIAAANAAAARLADELGVSSSVRLSSARRGNTSNNMELLPIRRSTSPGSATSGGSSSSLRTPSTQAATKGGMDTNSLKKMEQFQQQQQPHRRYCPPTLDDDTDNSVSEPYEFDQHGNRAPYRQGPYDYSHHQDGRLIKKRWCEFVFSSFLDMLILPMLILTS
jgi:hypothetical protein